MTQVELIYYNLYSLYLNRRRSECEDLVPGALGVAVHVDEDVDPVLVDPVGRLAVAGDARQVDEVLGLAADLLAERRAVVRGEAGIKRSRGKRLSLYDAFEKRGTGLARIFY